MPRSAAGRRKAAALEGGEEARGVAERRATGAGGGGRWPGHVALSDWTRAVADASGQRRTCPAARRRGLGFGLCENPGGDTCL